LMPPGFLPNNVFVPTDASKTNTMLITSPEVQRSNASNFDFSPLVFLAINLTANNGQDGQPVNLNTLLVNGGTAQGPGPFVQQGGPEPSTLTLGTLALVLMAGYRGVASSRRKPDPDHPRLCGKP